jgi:RNA polymerase sigma-70 factor (ECF subfamily)
LWKASDGMPSHAGQPPFRPTDEEILAAVRALRAGAGQDAFAPIYFRFLPPLLRFFSNRPELREEARDLAQKTLVQAFQNIGQYRFEAPFAAWIRQIGENVWRNAVRDRRAAKRDAPVESLDAVESEGAEGPHLQVADPAPSPEDVALKEERLRVLRAAMSTLPDGMRRCIELRVVSDLKYKEIAEVTGIGIDSVRSQLHEAKQRLKPVLEEYFSGADL